MKDIIVSILQGIGNIIGNIGKFIIIIICILAGILLVNTLGLCHMIMH